MVLALEATSQWPANVSVPIKHDQVLAELASLDVSSLPKQEISGIDVALATEQYLGYIGIKSRHFVVRRQTHLLEAEREANELARYLPKMGFEVEYPDNLRYFSRGHESRKDAIYSSLIEGSTALGLPKNRATYNGIDTQVFGMEYASLPSQSAKVQTALLAGLLKGEFLPHLILAPGEDLVTAITKNFSSRGVSLHLNFEVPKCIQNINRDLRLNRYLNTIIGAFAIAYSSPQRLTNRTNSEVLHQKKAWGTGDLSRVETIVFEVSDQRVYRLMEELQYAMGGAFALLQREYTDEPLDEIQGMLADAADKLYHDIEDLYASFPVSSVPSEGRGKLFYAECAQDKKLVATLRQMLTKATTM